jgi:hypothetical protein
LIYAADDVEAIAKKLKELEAEKQALLGRPLEEEPSNAPMWGIEASGYSIHVDTTTVVDDPFWHMLVRNGVVKIVSE